MRTDYYYQNYYTQPRYEYYDRYDQRDNRRYWDPYYDSYRHGNSTYHYYPYDWYYYKSGQYQRCNGDDFKSFDCSYRWDGIHYYYDLGPDDYWYYREVYDIDNLDVTDRFSRVNGRYSLCPRNGFDHDECVYYFKGGAFYYDDPADNFFFDENVEWDTDLDDERDEADDQDDDNQDSMQSTALNSYTAYYNQFSQFNFENGQFVPCSANCRYYQSSDGRMYGMVSR